MKTPSIERVSSVHDAIQDYLDNVALSRSANTSRTYRYALNVFLQVLDDHNLSPAKTQISELSEDAIAWFASALKPFSPATERLYLTAVAGFYEFLIDVHCLYRNSVRFDELITVRTWVKEVHKRMITFNYHILRKERGKEELIAEGETRHVSLDSSGTPKSLPKELFDLLAQ